MNPRVIVSLFVLFGCQFLCATEQAPVTAAQAAGLVYNVHMSDCENRWVALYHKPTDADYTYGFVYIDPQKGFTVHVTGRFTVDSDGNFHEASNPIPSDKYSMKIRLEKNGVAALLPPAALEQLNLPERPEWMKYYEDKAEPTAHKINWGSFYNVIGDSQRALEYLEPVYREKPDIAQLIFELAYAYNALGRSDLAIRVARPEFTKNPTDEMLCRELAYAYMTSKSFQNAAEQYHACIALCGESQSKLAEKSELAMNLSATYAQAGDDQKSSIWRNRARQWAPKGSPIYKYFHSEEKE